MANCRPVILSTQAPMSRSTPYNSVNMLTVCIGSRCHLVVLVTRKSRPARMRDLMRQEGRGWPVPATKMVGFAKRALSCVWRTQNLRRDGSTFTWHQP